MSPPPQRRGGRVHGAEGYHKEDTLALLECVRKVVPTTTEEWDQVLLEYRKTHAIPNTRSRRDTNSLKVKFKQLARHVRSGESVQPELLEAGSILELIEAKMAGSRCLQRRGGRARGAEGFSAADSQAILRTVRELLPVTRSDWEQVAQEYCKVYAVPNDRLSRDGISLKSKFRNWLKNDVGAVPRAEVNEALAICMEINAKMNQGKNVELMEDSRLEKVVVSRRAEDVEERNTDTTEVRAVETADAHEDSTTSSESRGKRFVNEPRRGGRTVGSEGYSQADKWALISCVKKVLPSGPTSWERVLQLYRMNHAIPNDRAQRNLTGIKSKFRQLVNWKYSTGMGKTVPEETLEARAVQRDIDFCLTQGKRQRSESESIVSTTHAPEEVSPDRREEHTLHLTDAETRKSDNVERQNMVANATERSVSAHVPVPVSVVKRRKGRSREQREAEQAAWEKERAMREKQRMDMDAWTIVCDRLRLLYRERATEDNPDIVSEFDDEIAVLKIKKQRLAGLMI
ncbi:unnamed protein product [Peronospora destructor]|uniref:Myb-like domain-containing protein n=1 Tax=Peronospora destructor TaxID=86335 RepID=A0AAV0UBA1_9STRA|nr:unnamed protein product [Peronospora destructor]